MGVVFNLLSDFVLRQCIAEELHSENAHRQGFCIALHRHVRVARHLGHTPSTAEKRVRLERL